MPKLKENLTDKQLRQMVASIKYGMEMYQVDMYELSLAAQMHRVTLYQKFKNPQQFRLQELINIGRKLHMNLISFGEEITKAPHQ